MDLTYVQNLPDGEVVYDIWGVSFIKSKDGLTNCCTHDFLTWKEIKYWYGDSEWDDRD